MGDLVVGYAAEEWSLITVLECNVLVAIGIVWVKERFLRVVCDV